LAIFTPISKICAIGSTLLFSKLKLQKILTIICKVANKILKIDPETKSIAHSITPFFSGLKLYLG